MSPANSPAATTDSEMIQTATFITASITLADIRWNAAWRELSTQLTGRHQIWPEGAREQDRDGSHSVMLLLARPSFRGLS